MDDGFFGSIGKAIGFAGGLLPPPFGMVAGAALGAYQGRQQQEAYAALRQEMLFTTMGAEYWTAQQQRLRLQREAFIEAFLLDNVGTWLAHSPGDETFGEWTIREEL